MYLQVRLKSLRRHLVGQDNVTQPVVKLTQLQARQGLQLAIKQLLDSCRRGIRLNLREVFPSTSSSDTYSVAGAQDHPLRR